MVQIFKVLIITSLNKLISYHNKTWTFLLMSNSDRLFDFPNGLETIIDSFSTGPLNIWWMTSVWSFANYIRTHRWQLWEEFRNEIIAELLIRLTIGKLEVARYTVHSVNEDGEGEQFNKLINKLREIGETFASRYLARLTRNVRTINYQSTRNMV